MISAQQFSIIAAFILLAVTISQRRLIFSWSAIGVFWITNFIFVFIGVLLFPWVFSILGQGPVWFPTMDFSQITGSDIKWSIILSVGGGVIVLLAYRFAAMFFSTTKTPPAPPSLLAPVTGPMFHGFLTQRLLLLSILPLLYAGAYIFLNFSDFIDGIRLGLLGGESELIFEARRESTSNYLFVLLVYNVIPFLGVALWLRFYQLKGNIFRYYAFFYNFCAGVFLILTFQKRPLLVFLISLILARFWIQASVKSSPKSQSIDEVKPFFSFKKAILYGGVLFGILLLLYIAHTNIGRSGESVLDSAQLLTSIVLIRIFGRLSIEPAMFVHFFPAIEPFYGFRSIGLVASFFGFDFYPSTGLVFQYFSKGIQEGKVAVAALIDFYGAFGLAGWLVGAVLVGFMLYWIDTVLARQKPSAANTVLKIFTIVFVYYLSQTSLNRAMLGYGGGIFLLLWLLVKSPARSSSASQTHSVVPCHET